MSQATVPIRVYPCPTPTFDETISACDRPIYDWLAQLPTDWPDWTPQMQRKLQIESDVQAAQLAAVAACEASKRQSVTPSNGVSIAVVSQLAATSGGAANADGLRAKVSVPVAPVEPATCPAIPYPLLHRVDAVSSVENEADVFLFVQGQPADRTGIGAFAGAFVFDASRQTGIWRELISQAFIAGQFSILSEKVFTHTVVWAAIDTPPPDAALLTRAEPFNPASVTVTGAPTFPRFLVLHRFVNTSDVLGRWFAFWTWHDRQNSAMTWTAKAAYPAFSYGTNTSFSFGDFIVPDNWLDDDTYDPSGIWRHEAGVVDFATTLIGEVRYAGTLCAQFVTHFNEISPAFDPRTVPFLPYAQIGEDVPVVTIGRYKAAYRVLAIDSVAGVGIRITVKLINPFSFAACIVARMPFGSGSKVGAVTLGLKTVLVARNLAANAESAEVNVLLAFPQLPVGSYSYKLSDVVYDAQNGGGGVEHGFLCASGAVADGTYITTVAPAMQVTTSGEIAGLWGFYNPSGKRFWSQAANAGQPLTDTVFDFSVTAAGACPYATEVSLYAELYRGAFNCVVTVSCEIQNPDTGVWWPVVNDWEMTDALGHQLATAALIRGRYGAFVTVNAGSLYTVTQSGVTCLVCDTWSGGDYLELAAYLFSLHPMHSVSSYRNIVMTGVKIRPCMIFRKPEGFTMVSPADGIPPPPSNSLPPVCVFTPAYNGSAITVYLK